MAKKKSTNLPALLKEAQRIFNKWIRERDKEDGCISCGGWAEYWDAGHYVPQKGGSFLRFNEWNVNKECKKCNGFDGFHLVGYRKRLIEKIGLENVEWLEANRSKVYKWSREELKEIIEKYG
jgi:hypothetical protein